MLLGQRSGYDTTPETAPVSTHDLLQSYLSIERYALSVFADDALLGLLQC